MNESFKPDNYSTVSPYLVVEGASATIRFLEQTFGAVEMRRLSNEDGRVTHAEVRIDDTVVMLSDQRPEWPSVGAHIHVYVDDVDEVYNRALSAGATSVQEPALHDGRRGGVKDPGGTTWWIATHTA